jgi:phosphatidylinositol-3-phosphatase
MLGPLRSIHVTRTQLAAVAVVSALASALIITNALGHSAAQSAVIAELSHRKEVIREGAGGSTADPTASAADPADTALPSSYAPTGGSSGSGGSSKGSSSGSSSGTSTDTDASDGTDTTTTSDSTTSTTTTKSPVKHVFVIALSTPSYTAAWGSSSVATYLNKTLKPAGAFLENYETLTPSELPDYLALVSGQGPNADTEAECATYSDFPTSASPDKAGQVPGKGCVYPDAALTLGDQVTAAGHTWKGYIQDQTKPCLYPNSGAVDDTPLPGAGPQYDTRHNPFIYFHSLLDLGGCSENDVSLTELPKELKKLSTTPTFSYIAPGTCDDGAATSCAEGGPAGLAAEDAFLREWVPVIRQSTAYKRDGVIVIVFAQAGPTLGPGQQQTGALVLSRYAAKHKTIQDILDPYSILRGIEDLLGYKPLDHAKGATSFVPDALPSA